MNNSFGVLAFSQAIADCGHQAIFTFYVVPLMTLWACTFSNLLKEKISVAKAPLSIIWLKSIDCAQNINNRIFVIYTMNCIAGIWTSSRIPWWWVVSGMLSSFSIRFLLLHIKIERNHTLNVTLFSVQVCGYSHVCTSFNRFSSVYLPTWFSKTFKYFNH